MAAAYTWRIVGWSRAARVSVSRRNQARPGTSGARCAYSATCRLSTRSQAWYTTRSGVAATSRSMRNAGSSARTTPSSRSAGGVAEVIAWGNLARGGGTRAVWGLAGQPGAQYVWAPTSGAGEDPIGYEPLPDRRTPDDRRQLDDRRSGVDRRSRAQRRQANTPVPDERRSRSERRSSAERRRAPRRSLTPRRLISDRRAKGTPLLA